MKKKILAMTLLLAIMASMLVFAACKDDEPDEPKKLLGGFLSPDYERDSSIPSPHISCAYESDRFVFDIDDVTLTFYVLLGFRYLDQEENRKRFGDSFYIKFIYSNAQGVNEYKTIEVVSEPIYLDKYLSTEEHPYGFGKEMTIPKDIFKQDCGKIWFCVETFSTAGDVKPDSGSVAINYSKESEDTVRLSAYEPPVYLPGLMY